MAAAHHPRGALPDGGDGPPFDCRDSRGILSRYSRQAPILACRSRSSRSDKWGQLFGVSIGHGSRRAVTLRWRPIGGGGGGEGVLSLSRRPMFAVWC
jgi:hypothetical protein